ncbi:hypothetical protein Pan44_37150 [Caulifigura coniformis]|uniref:Spermatogenesis-associated protein 20-like TRX domain-containing protein n=1 Tax=Caulifigura coniformis TaxID=2527983 RepID=A0A517SHS2_9PLAN|nr:thioredoxin domain-containing protein [Caulifigura coniformis]QDT55669.1 hypothetical protein Pan44_37150 [Caulifigura coniformis]
MSTPSNAGRQANRLAGETSPYLLQHAYNPVDWYPWSDEAFERANAEDKPVFLSVGYSACHWCHVMERESFESDEIAAILNERFISIKVDREERPDIDQIYMAAVQALTQRGGWPMSVFLTPRREPFFGGTYWPPDSRMGMRGFREILQLIDEAWRTRREDVSRSAASLTQAVDQMASAGFDETQLSVETLKNAVQSILSVFDVRYGGFGQAPKFPHPMDLRLLIRCGQRFASPAALDAARFTLDRMAAGGIYDHLGGGFHRYSTDARWLVPHFEKMLYDNALLVPAYLDLWLAERRPQDVTVVRETLDYILREMTAPEGAFYSTQDADSEGEEGKFFVWTINEVESLLGPDEAQVFAAAYDLTPGGNWEGHTILNRPRPIGDVAKATDLDISVLEKRLADDRRRLFETRSRRIAPGRDDKVLTSWNGLMISAMAQAGKLLAEPCYVNAAVRAAEFLVTTVRDADGRLLHTFKDGRARFAAYLDDYACLIDGLIDLHQATQDARWLEEAIRLAGIMLRDFPDDDEGGFYYTASHHERLITRVKDSQDNATPSGNGVAATALFRLAAVTGDTRFEEAAARTLQALSGLMSRHPRTAAQSLLALEFALGPQPIVVILPGDNSEEADRMQAAVAEAPHPSPMVLVVDETDRLQGPLKAALEGKQAIKRRTTSYLCERGTCFEPLMDAAALRVFVDARRHAGRTPNA